jgi:hypothetical protein
MASKTTRTKSTSARTRKSSAKPAHRSPRFLGGQDLARESFIEKAVQEFNAVTAAITDRLGAALPPFDPYMLLAILDNNGYLMRGNRWKVAATVGVGYTCSDQLKAHLQYANERDTFRQFLKKWAFDVDNFGYAFHEMRTGNGTCAFHNMPAIKTRVKPLADGSHAYIRYEYGLGLVFYQEYEEFTHYNGHGVSQYNLPSARGNMYYGDPEWIAARKAAELNLNILDVAQKYFENSLISDLAITMKGAELDPAEREQIRQYLARTMKGASNAHKVLFFEVGPNEAVEFKELNQKMDDSALNMRKENKEEVVVTNGVPQRLIGILTAGQLGGVGEVEGQMKVFKVGFADDRQQDYTDYWQRIIDEAGLPDAETFEFLPMQVDTSAADLPELTQAAGGPIISVDEAHNEWVTNKSMGGALSEKYRTFDSFISDLRSVGRLLEQELA